MAILTLGPEGTFSHQAAVKLHPKRKLLFASSIHELFHKLPDRAITQALVPLEIADSISAETILNFMRYDFAIQEKSLLPMKFILVGAEKFTHLFSDPLALHLCRTQLQSKEFKWIETPNVGASGRRLKEHGDAAALISPFANSFYDLPELETIDSAAFSTFFSVGKEPSKKGKHSGSAFLLFSEPMATTEKQVAEQCHRLKAKLLKMKDLVLQEGNTPLYFIEIEGHIEERSVSTLFEWLSDKFLIKHLGSYPL
jgi:prephenate dehydratase